MGVSRAVADNEPNADDRDYVVSPLLSRTPHPTQPTPLHPTPPHPTPPRYAASQANMAGTDSVVHSIQNGIVQPAAPRLSVMPPAWEDFSSGEESDQEDERPLTREELQRKTLRGFKVPGTKGAKAKGMKGVR